MLQDDLTNGTIVDGWLHTWDIRKWIKGNYLQVVVKKQMIKASFGKFPVPQAIESRFNGSPVIDWIIVVG